MDRLNDDVPEVVAAALRVLEVSEVTPSYHGDERQEFSKQLVSFCSLIFLLLLQVLLDVLDPEDIVSCLLSLLHRADLSDTEHWSVNYSRRPETHTFGLLEDLLICCVVNETFMHQQ